MVKVFQHIIFYKPYSCIVVLLASIVWALLKMFGNCCSRNAAQKFCYIGSLDTLDVTMGSVPHLFLVLFCCN